MSNSKSLKIITLLLFCVITSYAQKNFYPAKWTKPDGTQTDILIDFRQWEITPEIIRYKLAEGAPEAQLQPNQVRELKVLANPEEIYIGRETEVAVFSKEPAPTSQLNWTRKAIFLRALVLGNLNLYKYQDEQGIRHYFIQKDTIWEELIYHQYFTDLEQKVARTHFRYRTQLLRATFDCSALSEKIKNLAFYEKTLVNIVADYNSSICGAKLLFREQKAKGKIQLGVRVGGAITFNKIGFEFGSKYNGQHQYFRSKFGISALIFQPRSLHRKALLLDIMYDEQTYETTTPVETWMKDNFIQTHLSMRQYYPIAKASFFINGGATLGVPVGEGSRIRGWTYDYSPSAQGGLSFGTGARWKRLEAETRLIANHVWGVRRGGVDASLTWIFTLCFWVN